MPSADEILRGLTQIANDALLVSIAWHVVVGACAVVILAGYRPQNRIAAALLSAPLASVSLLAWASGNPFNGAIFALLAVVLAVLAWRGSTEPVALAHRWSVVLGSLLVGFGWVYPHFLEGQSVFAYLYAAPLGTIPCPTLSLVIGVALVGGLGPAAWRILLAAAACFYALFGAFRLGVAMDTVLLVGAVGLVAFQFAPAPAGGDE